MTTEAPEDGQQLQRLRQRLGQVNTEARTLKLVNRDLQLRLDRTTRTLGLLVDASGREAESLGREITDLQKAVGGAYRERARLVAFLAAAHPSRLQQADDVAEPGWFVVYVDTPAGQLSWHIHPDDLELFDHVELDRAGEVAWDGHDTDAKYARLACLTRETAKEERRG